MTATPLWGHSSIPTPAKVSLAAVIAVVITPVLPPMPDVPLMSWAGLGIIVEQMLIGIAIGLVMHIVFAVVQAAGEFIGLQMGLAFASFFRHVERHEHHGALTHSLHGHATDVSRV